VTTTTLVPNSTILAWAGASIVGGSGSQHAAISDASDSTYLSMSSMSTAFGKYGLGTFTIPAGALVKAARVQLRTLGAAGPRPTTAGVSLRDSTGVELQGYSMPIPFGGPTDIATASAGVVNWTQTVVDNLQFWIRKVNSGNLAVFLYEAEVELTYVAKPTVTVTGPSGTITTATPSVTFTFVGDDDADDGGALRKVEARVFTAAQYGAGGFDAATSTAAWESGVVDSDSAIVVAGPLDDGITYKAYVRAAQLVNGTPQWSDFDDGSTFTTDTDPPVVDTITIDTTSSWEAGKLLINVARDTGAPDWTHVNLERAVGMVTDPSTVDPDTYETVRGALQLAAPNDTIEIPDYEQPEGVWIYYRARGLIITDGAVVAQGEWTEASALLWNSDFEWLRSKDDPTNALAVRTVMQADHTESTEHRVALFDVDQREDQVPIWGAPAMPAGVLPLQTYTDLEAAALDALLRTSGELLFQGRAQFGHRRKWLVVTSHTKSRFESLSQVRSYELTYVEIDTPPVLS
jgi:hypothetical protein